MGTLEEARGRLVNRGFSRCAWGVILGSGLGDVCEHLDVVRSVPYRSVPGLKPCTVGGHEGSLLQAEWAGTTLLVLKGRLHLYEGRDPEEVSFPVRLLRAMGARRLVLVNTAGSLVTGWAAGELMVVRSHLWLMRAAGKWSFARIGGTGLYSEMLRKRFVRAAGKCGMRVREGVLAFVTGPSYETRSEALMLDGLGAHAVSMSLVPEALRGFAEGLEVLGVSCLANRAGAGDRVTHEEVLSSAELCAPVLGKVLRQLVSED